MTNRVPRGATRHRLRRPADVDIGHKLTSPRRHGGRHRRPDLPDARNLRLLWAGQFINTAGLMMLVPIMPFYIQRMGVSGTVAVQSWAGAAIAAPALALVVATPLWGKLGDRIGRKWMVVRALIGLAAAMLVMATATTPLALVAGRLLQGILGGVVEAAAGFASTSGQKGQRGSTLGKSFGATAAGSLLGPIAGGTMVGSGELGVLMAVIASLATLLAIICAVRLVEPRRLARTTRPARVTAPSKRRAALTVPLAVAAVAAYLGVYGLIPVFAQYTQSLVDQPDSAGLWVGIAQSLTWGATLISSAWWGRRNDTTGRPMATFALAAAGCGLAIAAQSLPLGLFPVLGLRVVQGACFAALAQSLFFHASSAARADRAGAAVGSANSFLLAGQSIGPLLAGPLVSALPVPSVIALLGASCLVAAVLAGHSARHEERPTTDRASRSESAPRPGAPVEQLTASTDPPTVPLRPIIAATTARAPVPRRSIARPDLVTAGRDHP